MKVISRRCIISGLASGASIQAMSANPLPKSKERKGRIKQVIAAWPFMKAAGWTPQDLIRIAQSLGISGVELFSAEQLPLLQGTGLVCGATKSHSFVRGMNNKNHHPEVFEILKKAIIATGAAGFTNVMTFTGMADTSQEPNGSLVSREEGTKNCIEGFKKMAKLAEKHRVSMVLEPLNTRATEAMKGHPGYQGDHIDYCMEIVRAVSSPGLKILFDAYHIQIMDGDLIKRINQYHEFIGHVQIAGNPGRGEIGDNQEINYRAVMKALLANNYQGYVGHEWIPTGNALQSLQEAIEICDI
jgi:hydroxypyruvate isomerase